MVDNNNLLLHKKEEGFFVEYLGALKGGRIAYRIFQNGNVVEKFGYGDRLACFFNVFPGYGVWQVQAYLKNDTVEKIKSNVISIPQSICSSSINPSYYEIRSFGDIDKEIDDFYKTGFVAMGRQDLKPWKIELPIDWLSDPYADRNWMFQFQAWRMLDPFLRRFSSEDVDYVSKVINDWTNYELEHNVGHQKWLWYDMSTGLRALKISFFLLRCLHDGKQHSVVNLNYLLEQHIAHLTNKKELSSGNHGLFQLNGLMSLVWVIERALGWNNRKELVAARNFAVTEMEDLLSRQFGEYGVHTEDSPDYHFFALKKVASLIEAPWWKEAKLEKIKKLLQKSEDAKYWLVAPSGECVPIGDSTRSKKVKDTSGLYSWPHEEGNKEIAARLDGYAVIRTKPELRLEQSSFLFFQGSFYSGAHKHADDLSFVWQEKGRYILVDSGKYGYQSDRFRSYFQSSLAHNTITIDGTSPSRSSRDAYGSALEGKPFLCSGYWILSGAVSKKELSYKHRRVVLYKPKHSLLVVDFVDNLEAKNESRNIQISWHFDVRFSVSKILHDSVVADDIKSKDRVHMSVSSLNGSLSIDSYKGLDKDEMFFGWVSNSYLEFESSPSVLVNVSLKKSNIILTKFNFENSDHLDILSVDKNGLLSSDNDLLKCISKCDGVDAPEKIYIAKHYNNLPYAKHKNVAHCFIPNAKSKSLFVSFHGSIKPATIADVGSALPVFRLHDLSVKNQPNILCFSDLLLDFYKTRGVCLGWFLDTKKFQQRDLIHEIVIHYAEKHNVEHILFHGSSGGGHVAVDLAARTGQTALVSNCQFKLEAHFQFQDLTEALLSNDDEVLSFDLNVLLKQKNSPKIISYCNSDDYTLAHHEYLNEIVERTFPGSIKSCYFSGADIAKKKGVKNHNIGFPNGMHVRQVLDLYYQSLS